MEKFKIATQDGLWEVEGERTTIAGVKCFTHSHTYMSKDGDYEMHFVSHLETGYMIAEDLDPDVVWDKACNKIMMHSEKLRNHVEKISRKIKLPVNV